MANELSKLSQDLTRVVAAAGRSVVRVAARRAYPVSGLLWRDELVVTASRTVQRESGIELVLDGEPMTADLVGRDPATDLALLRSTAPLAGAGGAVAPVAAAGDLSVGQLVLAIGRPSHGLRAAFGMLGMLGDSWRTPMGGVIDRFVQPGMRMFPGFTGGPLVDAEGRAIGINTRGLARGEALTVPMSTVERIASELLERGHVRRGYLGVSTQRVELPASSSAAAAAAAAGGDEAPARGTALLVVRVEAESPAAQGGVHLGDTIVRVGDARIMSHEDLVANLGADSVGEQRTITVLRGGQEVALRVTVGER